MSILLCFHGIGRCAIEREPGEREYWISRDTFAGVLDLVAGVGGVGVSFDDGNRSDVEVALPELRSRGLHATFFPLAGRLEDPASLSAADLVELRAAGMDVGSHGWRHVPFAALPEPEARREMVDARVALAEASQGAIDELALPLGRYDRHALRGLRREGYRTVYTSDRFPAKAGAWLQARYSVSAADSVESVRDVLLRRRPIGEAVARGKSLVKRSL